MLLHFISMKIVHAPRAAAVLYQLLKSRTDVRPWLLPANICPIVPITFLKAGVSFEFVDISAETLHMDLDQAEAEVKKRRFGGVLYAHTYGEESTPVEFFQSIKTIDDSIMVIDDRCLCIPDLDTKSDGAADVLLYSTGYAKIVELGKGGYAFMQDHVEYQTFALPFDARVNDEVEEAYKLSVKDRSVFRYRDSDWLETNPFTIPWTEYSTEIESALRVSLDHRTLLNEVYAEYLPAELQLSAQYQTWRFNITLENKAAVLAAIFQDGLFASSHYASLAGIMAPGQCPVAETLHERVINLFNDQHFDEARAEQVCKIVESTLG